jgi:hypothetical protein
VVRGDNINDLCRTPAAGSFHLRASALICGWRFSPRIVVRGDKVDSKRRPPAFAWFAAEP